MRDRTDHTSPTARPPQRPQRPQFGQGEDGFSPAICRPAPDAPEDIARAWGDYLLAYQWHHFATLSARTSTPASHLLREFEHGWVRRLARVAQRPLAWFVVAEQSAGGDAHLHALVYGTASLTVRQVQRGWYLGNTRVVVYNATRGAAGYVAKCTPDEHDTHHVSTRWPPLRASSSAAKRTA